MKGPRERQRSVLSDAHIFTDTTRESEYGHPAISHARIATMWSAILDTNITPGQVALCMVLVKVARLTNDPDHRDSVVDIAGYARTYQRIQDL